MYECIIIHWLEVVNSGLILGFSCVLVHWCFFINSLWISCWKVGGLCFFCFYALGGYKNAKVIHKWIEVPEHMHFLSVPRIRAICQIMVKTLYLLFVYTLHMFWNVATTWHNCQNIGTDGTDALFICSVICSIDFARKHWVNLIFGTDRHIY